MRRTLHAALLAIAVVLVPSASSENGIQMRAVPHVCHPVCPGDRAPTWSPDGERIAFLRFVQLNPKNPTDVYQAVFTVPASGGRIRPLQYAQGRAVAATWIRWSPDSAWIAYGRGEAGPTFLIDADGGQPVQLSPPPAEGNDAHSPPVWSADGSRMAFVRQGAHDRFRPNAHWCCQLWVARGDGSDARAIAGGKAPTEWLTEPVWLGSERIAYVTGPRDDRGNPDLARAEIWSANPDGTERRRLVGDVSDLGFSHLTWDASRARIYYIAELAAGARQLRWVDAEAHERQIATVPGEANCCAIAAAAESVAYTILGNDGAMELHVAGPAGDRKIATATSPQLGQRRVALTTAVWAPDGRRLVFVADRECPTLLGLHVIELASRGAARITQHCRISGNRRANVLRGGNRVDAIYGGAGNDTIRGLAKPDFLQGGTGGDVVSGDRGDDRVHGGPGRDRLVGGEGWDALYARDGNRDVVSCGPGDDAVFADARDRAARDCEFVERE